MELNLSTFRPFILKTTVLFSPFQKVIWTLIEGMNWNFGSWRCWVLLPLCHPNVPVVTTDHPPPGHEAPVMPLILPRSPLRSPRVSPPHWAGANPSRQIWTGSVRSCLNMLLTRWIFRVFIHFSARNLNVIYFQHHISCSYLVCYLSAYSQSQWI